MQNFDQQNAYIEISKDGEELNIFNVNLEEKLIYVLEADPNEIENKRVKRSNFRKKVM